MRGPGAPGRPMTMHLELRLSFQALDAASLMGPAVSSLMTANSGANDKRKKPNNFNTSILHWVAFGPPPS